MLITIFADINCRLVVNAEDNKSDDEYKVHIKSEYGGMLNSYDYYENIFYVEKGESLNQVLQGDEEPWFYKYEDERIITGFQIEGEEELYGLGFEHEGTVCFPSEIYDYIPNRDIVINVIWENFEGYVVRYHADDTYPGNADNLEYDYADYIQLSKCKNYPIGDIGEIRGWAQTAEDEDNLYMIVGWETSDGTEYYGRQTIEITGDMDLYAIWNHDLIEITLLPTDGRFEFSGKGDGWCIHIPRGGIY